RLLPALLRGGVTLEPVARLRTKRAGVAVGDRADRVEVVLDTVAVLDGNRVASTFAELEAEVVAGDGTALPGIEKALRKSGAGPRRPARAPRRRGGQPRRRRRPGIQASAVAPRGRARRGSAGSPGGDGRAALLPPAGRRRARGRRALHGQHRLAPGDRKSSL